MLTCTASILMLKKQTRKNSNRTSWRKLCVFWRTVDTWSKQRSVQQVYDLILTTSVISLWRLEYHNQATWESGVASMMQNSKLFSCSCFLSFLRKKKNNNYILKLLIATAGCSVAAWKQHPLTFCTGCYSGNNLGHTLNKKGRGGKKKKEGGVYVQAINCMTFEMQRRDILSYLKAVSLLLIYNFSFFPPFSAMMASYYWTS